MLNFHHLTFISDPKSATELYCWQPLIVYVFEANLSHPRKNWSVKQKPGVAVWVYAVSFVQLHSWPDKSWPISIKNSSELQLLLLFLFSVMCKNRKFDDITVISQHCDGSWELIDLLSSHSLSVIVAVTEWLVVGQWSCKALCHLCVQVTWWSPKAT